MTKTPVKFQKNQYKTVGGVAPKRYPLFIHIVIDEAQNWLSSTCEKQEKNAKRHNSRFFFDAYLIRIIMSHREEHVLIQIF